MVNDCAGGSCPSAVLKLIDWLLTVSELEGVLITATPANAGQSVSDPP